MSDKEPIDEIVSEGSPDEVVDEVVVEEVIEETPDDEIPEDDGKTNGLTILAALALLTVAGLGLHFLQDVFTPIFLALTLVLALRPLGQWLIARRVPVWIATTTVIIVIFALILGLLGITVWSLTPVPQTLMNYSGNFEATVNAVLTWLEERNIETTDLSVYLDQINFNAVVSWAWGLVDSLFSIGALLSIVGVAAFFLTIDTAVTRSRGRVVDLGHSNLGQAMRGFEKRVRHYWIVSTVFGLVVAAIDGVVLEMMGIPLAWTWAYWAFITNYIPNIGFFIGVIPPMIMALLDSGWQAMAWVLVLYSVINVVIQTFIQPKFTGDVVGLSPSVTFISLVVWTTIVGMLGSILAVPLTLFFKALLVDSDPRTRWLDAYLVSENEAERRRVDGRYDIEDPGDDVLPHLSNPFAHVVRAEQAKTPRRRKLSALSRQLRRSSNKDS